MKKDFNLNLLEGIKSNVAQVKNYKGASQNYYQAVKLQIDELFICYPNELQLMQIIPNSKWVKINFKNSEVYVVGLIGTPPQFICYGVPAVNGQAPAEALNMCNFVLTDKANDTGYYVLYQNANTGETILNPNHGNVASIVNS